MARQGNQSRRTQQKSDQGTLCQVKTTHSQPQIQAYWGTDMSPIKGTQRKCGRILFRMRPHRWFASYTE